MPDTMKLQGLHHLALVCSDMQQTVHFYTEILGMTLKKGFDLGGGYGQHFFFDMGAGNELAFFWFRDAPKAQPGVASAGHLVGRPDGTISSAHGSMNHVAIRVAPEDIDAYRDQLVAKGVDVTPVVNHDDVVTGQDERTSSEVTAKTWLRSCYFFDPDGIMLELTATVNEGTTDTELPVNADGIKANGAPITGA